MSNQIQLHQFSEIQVSYHAKILIDKPVTSSQDAVDLLKMIYPIDQIQFKEMAFMLMLNRANIPIGFYQLSSGGISGTVIDPKHVFSVSLKANACGIILSHNHPSGKMVPSESDKRLTAKIKKASKALDISLLDHVIVSAGLKYYSFADDGVL